MTIEEVEDILFDGSLEDMRRIAEAAPGASYRICGKGMTVVVDNVMDRMWGLSDHPNCSKYFGDSHTF